MPSMQLSMRFYRRDVEIRGSFINTVAGKRAVFNA